MKNIEYWRTIIIANAVNHNHALENSISLNPTYTFEEKCKKMESNWEIVSRLIDDLYSNNDEEGEEYGI